MWSERRSFIEHKEFSAALTPFLGLNVSKQKRKSEVRCGFIPFTVKITGGKKTFQTQLTIAPDNDQTPGD